MGRVRILPDGVANQIAAGEVIERPAAVVKELLENALDAGASRVSVEFAHGGRSLIRVEDDGGGMSAEDARLALLRHATSKIAASADLDQLSTYGFRGEALPSIASVSRFTLRTREASSPEGTEILVQAGRTVHERACGRPAGTAIDVEHLFEPVPARRKFLKSDRTESAHIVECVRLYALACPAVAFTLREDGREVFRSPACPTLGERVSEIFGPGAADNLVAMEAAEPGFGLSGLIVRPGVARRGRHALLTFVNGRPVDSRVLNGAVTEAYREHLPEGHFPAAFLFLTCDPAAVDVNVHPAKREVRFRSEALVRGFVIRSILGRLRSLAEEAGAGAGASVLASGGGAAGSAGAGWPAALGGPARVLGSAKMAWEPAGAFGSVPTGGERGAGAGRAGEAAAAFEPSAGQTGTGADDAAQPAGSAEAGEPSSPSGWRFLGTAQGNLAVFESGAGLVLLDRRAAHERIWYERLRDQFRAGSVPVQSLLLPASLELDPVASALLADSGPLLRAAGFEIVEFGRHFFRIEAIPAWMEPGDAEAFLRTALASVREGRITALQPDAARDELARLAAAKAVRLPPTTGEREMRVILSELFATRIPVASPSGRPTFVELGHAELARRFLAG